MRSLSLSSAIITLPIVVFSIFQVLPSKQVWALLLLSCLSIPAIVIHSTAAFHTILFCFLLVFLPLTFQMFSWWPFRLLMPLLAYHLIVLLSPNLRRSYMGLQRGHINKDVFLLMLATIFISTLALIVWCWLLKPDLSIYFGQIPNMPLIVIPLAGLAFSVMNAVMEEFAFRGIIMSGASNAFETATISVFFQAIAFGLFHYLGGFPNGVIGASLTFVYGVLLGFIRNRSQGMMAPVVTHIFADLVIFSMLITFLRMPTTS
jgi:uncharacterized protein